MTCACGAECTDDFYQTGNGPPMCAACYQRTEREAERQRIRTADRIFADDVQRWRQRLEAQ